MMVFLTGVVRVVGAFQAGVAMYLVPHKSQNAFLVSAFIGFLWFFANGWLERTASYRELVLRGYVVPLAFVVVFLLVYGKPDSWDAAGELIRRLMAEVFARTPTWVYLTAAAYGGYRAHVVAEANPFESPDRP